MLQNLFLATQYARVILIKEKVQLVLPKHIFVKFFTICICFSLIISCKTKSSEPIDPDTDPQEIAPNSFGFNTTRAVTINVRLLAGDDTPIVHIPVEFLPSTPDKTRQPLLKLLSDSDGYIKASISMPNYLDTLLIQVSYTGIMQNLKAYVSNNQIVGTLGGSKGFSGNFLKNQSATNPDAPQSSSASYVYMGKYNSSNGLPDYLTTPGDVITSSMLTYVNASLPERLKVEDIHPEYLLSNSSTTLNVEKQSDIWISFVGEGTDFSNALGYYTYTTGNPPVSLSDIKKVTYIFPNASFTGSGGQMSAGNKVKLGKFDAGTSIGFVVFQDGWNSGTSGLVNSNVQKWYSHDALNNETGSSNKRHSILLFDDINNLFLIGFEDLRRDNNASDEDFNDLVFYATTSVPNAVSPENVNVPASLIDTDGDTVADIFDQFPLDPARVYVNYFPSENVWGTLAFEDQWPKIGDYDLNDMVVGYRYKMTNNAVNNIVELNGSFMLRAVGASFTNGFGVEFPFAPELISSATGSKISGYYVQLASNGCETGQPRAVIVPFDKTTSIIKSGFVNTSGSPPAVLGDTVQMKILFKSPITSSTLGSAPFNPFIMTSQRRGYEVHLPNNKPTNKANKLLFGTEQDKSDSTHQIYYISKANWPYALSFSEPFNYPVEGVPISKAYLHFLEWASSAGAQFRDWYKNTTSSYQNTTYIYPN